MQNVKQTYFWINREDDLVWIEDYGKSLEKRAENKNGIRNTGAFLLIREKRFMELFHSEIKNLLQEGEVSSEITDTLCNNCTKMLRELQIIFKQYLTDSKWGKAAVEYPVFEWKQDKCRGYCYENNFAESFQCYGDEYYNGIFDKNAGSDRNWGEEEDDDENEEWMCVVSKEPVMQLNIAHPSVQSIKDRRGQAGCDPKIIFDCFHQREICGMEQDEIWKLRKSFASGKELYRK